MVLDLCLAHGLACIGFGTKAVITGYVTQIGLQKHQKSGLVEAQKILKDVKGISMTYLLSADVVRHQLVQKLLMLMKNTSLKTQVLFKVEVSDYTS